MVTPSRGSASTPPLVPRRRTSGRSSSGQSAVARAAAWVSSATALGWETVTAWDASTSTVCELARSAMKRWDWAGTARSCRVTIVQEGMVFQAARTAFPSRASATTGRWGDGHQVGDVPRNVGGEDLSESLLLDVEVVHRLPIGTADGHRAQRRP